MEGSKSFLLYHTKPQNLSLFTSVVILGGIIIAFLFAYTAFGEVSEGSTLQHASIIFRHGDKNPTSSYANDPFKDVIHWPEGWGQLTNKGKKQMFQLGQFLLARYGKFLGPYSSQTVRVDSSDHDRCHQSAGTLLAALFPPQGQQVWNDQLLWQPIPIHASPRNTDKLIVVGAPCPVYKKEKKKIDEELALKYDMQNADLFKYLTKHSGQNITSLLDVEALFNTLEIEINSGKLLPNWTDSVFPDKMKDIAALVLASYTYTPVTKRLRGGPLVKEINTNMKLHVNGASKRKLSLYSAHDLTIVNVRRALGFNDITFKPDFGSALMIELHIFNGDPQVELLYLESYAHSAPVRWEIPGCPAPCSLATFSETMASVIPMDWNAECQLEKDS